MSIIAIRESPMRPIDPQPASAPAPARPPPSGEPSSFARLLREFGREIEAGEGFMRSAVASGRIDSISGGELLALQAGVYRYSEAVDLATRIVDRATGCVKTVIQGQ
jgi:hypothetical protein